MQARPRRTSRLVRLVAFRARDGTVDAATSVVLSGVLPGYGARNSHAFRPWAVDAWPELTDAILTELSGG